MHPGAIHLLLTAVVLPQQSGRDLANRIYAMRAGLRVLCKSGLTEDAIDHHGVLEPGIHLLPKPFTPRHLANHV